jgi:hypothetical protein
VLLVACVEDVDAEGMVFLVFWRFAGGPSSVVAMIA